MLSASLILVGCALQCSSCTTHEYKNKKVCNIRFICWITGLMHTSRGTVLEKAVFSNLRDTNMSDIRQEMKVNGNQTIVQKVDHRGKGAYSVCHVL
jgi:hypothetical protein